MNRTFLTLFLFTMGLSPAFCQEPPSDPPPSDPMLRTDDPLSQDTLRQNTMFLAPIADSIPGLSDSVSQAASVGGRRSGGRAGREYDPDHSPYKAIMYALVLPGLGQGYNQRYFKIPIVYAALGGTLYAINFNSKQYRDSSYEYALAPNETNEWYLRIWRRNLELSYIGLILVYALQVIDAYVDANLYNWDVNSNLAVRIAPSLQPLVSPGGMVHQACGITCTFALGRN